MQISSALLSEQPGSLFHQPFLSSFHPLCCLDSMALIYHGLSLLNETTRLKKKGRFEGSSSGLPQPEFPSRASVYPGPISWKTTTTTTTKTPCDNCYGKQQREELNPFRFRKGREASRRNPAGSRSCHSELPCTFHMRLRASPGSPSLTSQPKAKEGCWEL